jgi:hypothetical protein
MSTTTHLLICSFHIVSDQLSFISSYYVSIPSLPCFTFSAMSATRHLLNFSFHSLSDQQSFLSFYYIRIYKRTCFPHLV